MALYNQFDVPAQAVQERHETAQGESGIAAFHQPADVGLINTQEFSGSALTDSEFLENHINLVRQNSFRLQIFGIIEAKIIENVGRTLLHLCHRVSHYRSPAFRSWCRCAWFAGSTESFQRFSRRMLASKLRECERAVNLANDRPGKRFQILLGPSDPIHGLQHSFDLLTRSLALRW
jgi:hypothetical protein